MMGIYLPNMEMPREGELLCIDIHPDGKVCINLDLSCTKVATAVPVPPHGDLIDRNAAYDKIAEQEGGNYVDMDAVDMGLNETPTIIPAEEGE